MTFCTREGITSDFALASPKLEGARLYLEVFGGFVRGEPLGGGILESEEVTY